MSTFRLYFRALFLKVFLEQGCNGKKDSCAVFGCNYDRLFLVSVKRSINHIDAYKRENVLIFYRILSMTTNFVRKCKRSV